MSFLKRVLIEKMRVEIAFFDMIRASWKRPYPAMC